MIIAWGLFIVSIFMIFVWYTEFIPSFSENKPRVAIKNIAIWFLVSLFSAQYIWG